MSQVILLGQQKEDFFPDILDFALVIIASISTFISLLIPCLYYIKKQCQQHPTVLIANISLLESIANFNIVLMAINIFQYENLLDIKDIFHFLTFNVIELPSLDQNSDFCFYNYCVYMLVELLSISFHICYSVDLFITIKYPFFNGKKRRKYYYVFSLLFPILTLVNSIKQATDICEYQLKATSIIKVPLWFLLTLIVFCGISVLIVILSFIQKKHLSKIRRNYIHHHRIILGLLVAIWICPIWANYLIVFQQTKTQLFKIVNILAFFCIVSATGIINTVRMIFDPFLRQRIIIMITKCKVKRQQSQIMEQNYIQLDQQTKIIDQIWNLPLSEAMNQFQSQDIVHKIIQVVSQTCNTHHNYGSDLKESHVDERSERSSFTSVCKNSIIVESQIQDSENSLLKLFRTRQQLKYQNMDPHDATVQDLKQLCKRKRKFNMVCMNSIQTDDESDRLGHKTVVMKSDAMKGQKVQSEVNQLLSIIVTSYSHRIFETLRKYDYLTPENISQTLSLQNNIDNIKKAKQSLGASGSFFFFSFDHKLVIKTISQQQKDRFVQILPYYFDHIRYNQNSLLARTYGIYSIEIAGTSKIYFIMMQNTFKQFQQYDIAFKAYDMKGSTVQRQVKDSSAFVLKDINYFKSADCFIFMSKQNKIRFIDQITKDIDMLKKHNIMDYSLLLGVGKSKCMIKKKNLFKKGGIVQRKVQNFRYVTQLEQITRRVYSISIIDYLQEYNWNKKLQLWLKKIFKGGGDISSVNTEVYYQRFLKFLNRIIVTFNIKFQRQAHLNTTI